ncbi:MAG: hypothetical protein WDN31_07455 [Hyphomicrobium sp.]
MQPLATSDLVLNIFVAIVMPLIIAANLLVRAQGGYPSTGAFGATTPASCGCRW